MFLFHGEQMSLNKKYDVIIVGGGHAGCEAVLACAKRGLSTLLLTGNIDQIGAMSCNPAIGGLGKGHIVKEIDALGGEMAKNIDETGIQFRRLNTNKGTAVQGTRAQADKYIYKTRMRWVLEQQQNLDIKQGIVKKILVKNSTVQGVELTSQDQFLSQSVVLTTGTFLRGLCHVGLKNFSGGRAGDVAANDLSGSLIEDCGLDLMRLKTGTVPRLDSKTINWSGLEEQKGDDPLPQFSFTSPVIRQKQISCFITYTNEQTHEHIRNDLDKSPMFQGVIEGVGPRYCPSIEDKVVRFADKDRHQIFLEPEGLMTNEVYPNGLSTSLPLETQIKFLRTIPGLEHVEVMRPGYAVEYDAANPVQIKNNYETKSVVGLFLAGQINGTSGYEEAAGQGLMAGINAGQYVLGKESVVLGRGQAYIGVMTDDLTTRGVGGEPYRMFTSRAEYRLILREDNADFRLRKIGYDLGLVDEETYQNFLSKMEKVDRFHSATEQFVKPAENDFVQSLAKLTELKKLPPSLQIKQSLKWPQVELAHLKEFWDQLEFDSEYQDDWVRYALSEIKYDGYIQRYQKQIDRMKNYDKIKIPSGFDFEKVPSLSIEIRERLNKNKPQNLGQAMRLPGITPTAISHLEVFLASKKSA